MLGRGGVGPLIDLLLPRTDAGVAVQLALVAVGGAAALAATWRRVELRIFVVGLLVFLLGLAGVRALH